MAEKTGDKVSQYARQLTEYVGAFGLADVMGQGAVAATLRVQAHEELDLLLNASARQVREQVQRRSGGEDVGGE